MPKVKPSELEQRRRVVRAMLSKTEDLSGKSKRDMATSLHMGHTTYYKRKAKPEEINLETLWRLVDKYHLSDEDILAIAKGKLQ